MSRGSIAMTVWCYRIVDNIPALLTFFCAVLAYYYCSLLSMILNHWLSSKEVDSPQTK